MSKHVTTWIRQHKWPLSALLIAESVTFMFWLGAMFMGHPGVSDAELTRSLVWTEFGWLLPAGVVIAAQIALDHLSRKEREILARFSREEE